MSGLEAVTKLARLKKKVGRCIRGQGGGSGVHGGVTSEKKVAKLQKVTNTKCFKCSKHVTTFLQGFKTLQAAIRGNIEK